MALPHFEVITFPGQLFWLLLAAGITYGFNKFVFLPSLSSSITKRQQMINDYQDETSKIEKYIDGLQADIELLHNKGQVEVKKIIEQAVSMSQVMLFEHTQRNNAMLMQSMEEYDKYIEKSKSVLAQNTPSLVQDLKDKLSHFISRQNI